MLLITQIVGLMACCQRTNTLSKSSALNPFNFNDPELSTEISDETNLQRLTIGYLNARGQIVIDFSERSNYARAFWENGELTPTPGSTQEFDDGKPANLVLQLDASGETVLFMVFGGTYMSNHAARAQLPDGNVVPNNPVVEFNGTEKDIIETWRKLSKTNESFRIELLDESESNESDLNNPRH